MNLNLRLRGLTEEIVEEMIREGIAESKTEAIRIALLFFWANFRERKFKEDFIKKTLEIMRKEDEEMLSGFSGVFR